MLLLKPLCRRFCIFVYTGIFTLGRLNITDRNKSGTVFTHKHVTYTQTHTCLCSYTSFSLVTLKPQPVHPLYICVYAFCCYKGTHLLRPFIPTLSLEDETLCLDQLYRCTVIHSWCKTVLGSVLMLYIDI